MPLNPIVLNVVFAVLAALFAFQLWSVVHTGHVQWHIGKVHRAHRPIAYALEVTACAIGLMVFGGLLIVSLTHH